MGDTNLQHGKGQPDFRIYTAALEVESAESTLVRMVGSSTEQDVQRNRMAESAIADMCEPALKGMTIFLNHSYNIPQDVYGSLIEAPTAMRKDGFVDVHLAVDTDMRNPPAVQVLQQVKDGRKHGCSIGCMVDKWAYAEEDDDPNKDAIIIERVRPVEWSVVGIPANRRSWVENAIYGVFTRSLSDGNFDEAFKLAPTVKSLYSRNYERIALNLSSTSERTRFERVTARPTPTHQLFWEPSRKTFIMQGAGGLVTDVDRTTIMTLLSVTPELAQQSEQKDTAMDLNLLVSSVAINTDGSHETTSGHHSHPHSDMHEGLHDHHHTHGGDNVHNHTHDIHLGTGIIGSEANESGGDDHDGDADDTALAATATATAEIATPVVEPVVLSTPPLLALLSETDRASYLHSYNALGRVLGFTAVDDNGHLPTPQAGVATTAQFTQAIETLERLAATAHERFSAVSGEALETLYLALALSPTTTPAEVPLSADSLVHVQRAHRALTLMLERADQSAPPEIPPATSEPIVNAPPPATPPVTTSIVPNTALSLAVDTQEVQAQMIRLQAQLAEQKTQHALLVAQYEVIRGQGMGRPTSFNERVVPASMLDSSLSIEAQTPEQLKAGTTLVKRLDGVLCRKWPHGLGVHQRPDLTTTQMSIMTNTDVRNYDDGLEVLVPHFNDD